MSEPYEGRIKVVCPDCMCFPVDPLTYEPLGPSVYDPYFTLPEPGAYAVISSGKWADIRDRLRRGLIVPDAAGATL